MTTLLKISTRVLSMVRPCIAERDIRYYLEGIHVEPNPAGGVIAVATDGHRIAAALDPKGECAAPLLIKLPKDAWKFCNAATPNAPEPRHATNLVVSVDDRAAPTDDFGDFCSGPMLRGWQIAIQYGMPPSMRVWVAPEARPCIVEAKFPDWRRVLPKTAEEWQALQPCAASLNVYYLAMLSQHLKTKKGAYTGSRLWQRASDIEDPRGGVVLVQFDALPQLVVGVMPLRGDMCRTWTFPEFMGRAA